MDDNPYQSPTTEMPPIRRQMEMQRPLWKIALFTMGNVLAMNAVILIIWATDREGTDKTSIITFTIANFPGVFLAMLMKSSGLMDFKDASLSLVTSVIVACSAIGWAILVCFVFAIRRSLRHFVP